MLLTWSIVGRLPLMVLFIGVWAASDAGAQPFSDIGAAVGLPKTPLGVGANLLVSAVSVADVDGDGDMDLFQSGGNRRAALFVREGDAYAEDPTALVITGPTATATGHTLFDMDGDGDLDLLVLRDGPNALLENDGSGVFFDVTETHLAGDWSWSMSASAGDFDGDGDLDLYVANYIDALSFPVHDCARNQLLDNDGDGHFTDVTEAYGVVETGCSFVTAMLDWDDDGDLDLLTVNDFAQFVGHGGLFRNDGPRDDGGWAFEEIAADVGFRAGIYGMGLGVGASDATGALQLALSNIGEPLLYARGPDGMLVDVTAERGGWVPFASVDYQVTWASELIDLDGDGWQDVVMAAGQLIAADFIANPDYQANLWLRGQPDGSLVEQPVAAISGPENKARDLAFTDFNGDGQLDIVLAHIDGRMSLLKSGVTGGVATTLDLVPTLTAPGAAGARVEASCQGVTRVHRLSAGRFYGSADDGRVRLTFPEPCHKAGKPVDVALTWPSGFRESFSTTTGAAVVRTEPAWISVTPDAIRVNLAAGDSTLDPTGALTIAGAGVTVGAIREVEGAVLQAELARDGDATTGRLDLALDGEPLGAHPRITWSPTRYLVRPYPQRPVVDRDTSIWIVDSEAQVGAGQSESVTVTAGGAPLVVVPGGSGRWLAPWTPAVAGPAMISANIDDASVTAMTLVHGRVDPTRSSVRYRNLQASVETLDAITVWARAELVDVNGEPFPASEANVRLTAGGVEVPIDSFYLSPPAISARYRHGHIPEGAAIQLWADEARIGDPQKTLHLKDLTDLWTIIDADRSWCQMSERRLIADGQDIGTTLVFVHDAGGTSLSVSALHPAVVGDGVSAQPGSIEVGAGGYRVQVGADLGASDGRVDVSFGASGAAISCEIPLIPPPTARLAVDPELTDVFVMEPPLEAGAPARLVVVPRKTSGRAYGSGLAASVSLSQGVVEAPLAYVGFARYEAVIRPDDPGAMSVTVQLAAGQVHTRVLEVGDAGTGDTVEGAETADVVERDETSDAATGDVGDVDVADEVGPVDTSGGLDTHDEGGDTLPPGDTRGADSLADTGPRDSGTMPDTSPADSTPIADSGPTPDTAPVDTSAVERRRSPGGCASGPASPPPPLVLFVPLILWMWTYGRKRAVSRVAEPSTASPRHDR